jgi:hypothetical protein
MSAAKTTTDHDVIRQWAEQRGGRPAAVAATHKDDQGGLLRIDFGEKEDTLDEISWSEFFRTFDERQLAFLYQDETGKGGKSRFFKFVRRDEVEK